MLQEQGGRPEPTEREKAHVSKLLAEIKAYLDDSEIKARFAQFDKYRKTFRGYRNGERDKKYRTNLIYANIAAILPQVYAKDPDISFSPTEIVEPARYALVKKFAKTGEIVTREQLRRADLKRRAKAAVRSTMTVSLSWWKVGWQDDKRTDPQITNRINDVQDDIERLKLLANQSEDAQGGDQQRQAKQQELEAQLAALQTQNIEITVARGVVIDPVRAEDVIVLDSSVTSFDEYPRARRIAHRMWLTAEQFEATFGYKPQTGRVYAKQSAEGGDATGTKDRQGYYCVYEVWDKSLHTVFTVAEGHDRYCRAPLVPQALGERWYPFFGLIFNPVADEFWPLSDVELLEKLCDEYNDTRDDLAKHRRENLPVRVARAGGSLTDEDLEKIQNRQSNDIIVINGTPGKPLQDDLAVLDNPPIDVNNYDTAPIRSDIEQVLGASDASRGTVMKAKTATEAEIVAQGLRSRTEERQDTIEDLIEDVAKYVFEMCLMKLSLQEVQKIAGPDAEWPEMSVEQAFSWLNVRVQAGTSGKPNRLQEQDRWIQILPLIKEGLQAITDMRAAGNDDMATAVTELIRETMRRFDERMDVDKFIPPVSAKDKPIEQMAPEEMAAALERANAVIEQLQQQLQEATDEQARADQMADKEHARKVDLEMVKKGLPSQFAPPMSPDGAPMPAGMPMDSPVDPVAALAPVVEQLAQRLDEIQQQLAMLGQQAQQPAQPLPIVVDTASALAPVVDTLAASNQAVVDAVAASAQQTAQLLASVAQQVAKPRTRVVEVVAPNGQVFRGQSSEAAAEGPGPDETPGHEMPEGELED